MIVTITFNPSLDYVVQVPDLTLGQVNRTAGEMLYPGGKGINVSIVLSNLGYPSRTLGFLAGFTGDQIGRMLGKYGCQTDFIHLPDGFSRINVKIQAGQESEINGCGPVIPPEAIRRLMDKLDSLGEGDILVLAGSIPATLPEDMYRRIFMHLQGRGVRMVVDATRKLLLNVLPYHPFLIKPNSLELGEIFGVTLRGTDEVIQYARMLQERGAANVLVSMAGDGAVLVDETGKVHQSRPPEGQVVNSVGAGDSMVAGFLAGWLGTGDYSRAFRLGLAAGSATAFSPWLASGENIRSLLDDPAAYGL